VTFLFSDVVDSTRLWDWDARAMSQAIERHDVVLRQVFDRHFGFVLTAAGDGFCVAFLDPLQAIRAAREGLQKLKQQDWETADPLVVRMAIHTGQAERRDGTYAGPPLNRASRILAQAHGNEILVSHTTRDALVATLDGEVRFSDLGERRLRGLSEPERIYRLEPDLTRT
jgi:class 3 adenylate cyclase